MTLNGIIAVISLYFTELGTFGANYIAAIEAIDPYNTRLGDRSFAAAGSQVWNNSNNPAAKVGHYTRTILTSTQKCIYLVTGSCSPH